MAVQGKSMKAKQLAAQLIPRFFKFFPGLARKAVTAQFDLVEEEDLAVGSDSLASWFVGLCVSIHLIFFPSRYTALLKVFKVLNVFVDWKKIRCAKEFDLQWYGNLVQRLIHAFWEILFCVMFLMLLLRLQNRKRSRYCIRFKLWARFSYSKRNCSSLKSELAFFHRCYPKHALYKVHVDCLGTLCFSFALELYFGLINSDAQRIKSLHAHCYIFFMA